MISSCPVCGKSLEATHRDPENPYFGPLLESIDECPDGCYSDEWAYGSTRVRMGEREWIFSDKTPHDDMKRIEAEISEEARKRKAERACSNTKSPTSTPGSSE
jgi:hypothetical protein